MPTLRALQWEAWSLARAKGLHLALRDYPPPQQVLLRLAWLHEAVSAAMRHVTTPAPPADVPGLAQALADIVTQCADLAEEVHIDLDEAVQQHLRLPTVVTGDVPREWAAHGVNGAVTPQESRQAGQAAPPGSQDAPRGTVAPGASSCATGALPTAHLHTPCAHCSYLGTMHTESGQRVAGSQCPGYAPWDGNRDAWTRKEGRHANPA